ncbi:(2Fe-2S)-binding protein [bacterium]|nr:(2Fe-2S)-binding protein [bacterium]
MSTLETPTRTDLVNVTIDGHPMSAPKGTLVIDLCKQLGIDIPHYCYHPSLSIVASCRMCLVEVEKMPKLAPACQLVVQEGMVVRTHTDKVEKHRAAQMEFFLLNHPLDCPVCDKGGECRLQRYSMDYGSAFSRFSDDKRRYPKQNIGPLIDLEMNRCIHCTRCVRFSGEVAGEHELYMMERADRSYISTFMSRPVMGPLSGNVIELCPVGCLTDKVFRFSARVWELKQTPVSCAHCPAGCSLNLWSRRRQVHRVTPLGELEDNQNFICNKGRYLSNFSDHADRVDTPRIADASGRRPVSVEEALAAAAAALEKAKREHGPDGIAILADGRRTCEEYYLLSRLARAALGTANLDYRTELRHPSAGAAQAMLAARSSAEPGRPGSVVILGSDLYGEAPIAALEIKEQIRRKGGSLLIAHHRACPWFYQYAQAQLVYNPGQAADFIHALLKASQEYLDDAAAERAGLVPQHVRDLAALLPTLPGGTLLVGARSIDGPRAGETALAVLRLLERLKTWGDWEMRLVMPEANGRGAFEAGFLPADLSPAAGALSAAWGGEVNAAAGLSSPEIVAAALAGTVKTLVLVGEDCLAVLDGPTRDALVRKLETLITFSSFNPPASWPGIQFPIATRYEDEGATLDLWGREVSGKKAFDPPPRVLPLRELCLQLAARLGKKWNYASARDVTLDWKRLRPSLTKIGAPDLSAGATSGILASGELWWIVDPHLFGRDPLAHRSPACDLTAPRLKGQIHPATARALGLSKLGRLRVWNDSGEVVIPVEVTPLAAAGALYAPRNLVPLHPGGEYPARLKVECET